LLEAELKQDVDSVDRSVNMLLKKMSAELSTHFDDWGRRQLQKINSVHEQFEGFVCEQEVQKSRLNALQTAFTTQLEAASFLESTSAVKLNQRVGMMEMRSKERTVNMEDFSAFLSEIEATLLSVVEEAMQFQYRISVLEGHVGIGSVAQVPSRMSQVGSFGSGVAGLISPWIRPKQGSASMYSPMGSSIVDVDARRRFS